MNNEQLELKMKLHKALIAATSETQDVHADDYNPHFKSKFASLGAHLKVIKPIFAKHGLAIVQIPATQDGMVGIITTIIHEEGGSLSGFVGIPVAEMNGQHAGAAISYLRRYSLASAAGVATEDDDANSISSPAPSKQYSGPSTASTSSKSSPKASAASSSSDSGNPRDVQVHFGKNKGVRLGDMNEKQVMWYYENYKAEGYQGKPPRKEDLALRAALDAIVNGTKNTPATESDDDSVDLDEVPF